MNIQEAVANFSTPFYLYDKERLVKNCRLLKSIIPEGTELFYSVKANPLFGICRIIKNEGLGFEIASAGELYTVIKAGVPANNIIFTSPGKTAKEIEFAIDSGIYMIHAESLDEIELIDKIAAGKNKCVDIGIRINPVQMHSKSSIKMSGVSSQFGISEDQLNTSFFEEIKALENIKVRGIQVYMGTQNLDAGSLADNTAYILNLAVNISEEYGIALDYVNCGGGFGVNYFPHDKMLDKALLKEKLAEVFEKFRDRLSGTRVVFESGRFIMAESGVFVTKILYDKVSVDTRYLICDGGSNVHASSAFLGRFVRNNFPISTTATGTSLVKVNITGPLCTPTDLIGKGVEVPANIAVGDYIVIEKSGAYGFTDSPFRFLSHEAPAEILVSEGEYIVLRKREQYEDILQNQNLKV